MDKVRRRRRARKYQVSEGLSLAPSVIGISTSVKESRAICKGIYVEPRSAKRRTKWESHGCLGRGGRAGQIVKDR